MWLLHVCKLNWVICYCFKYNVFITLTTQVSFFFCFLLHSFISLLSIGSAPVLALASMLLCRAVIPRFLMISYHKSYSKPGNEWVFHLKVFFFFCANQWPVCHFPQWCHCDISLCCWRDFFSFLFSFLFFFCVEEALLISCCHNNFCCISHLAWWRSIRATVRNQNLRFEV